MRIVLVVDAGEDIVGIYSVTEEKYAAYCGEAMLQAVLRIQVADEVVTYNGNRYDISRLAEIAAEFAREFSLVGKHSDMHDICWGNILGSNLLNTYSRCVGSVPEFPDTYEGSNERDVYMTCKLWELWQQGGLTDIHGRVIPKDAN